MRGTSIYPTQAKRGLEWATRPSIGKVGEEFGDRGVEGKLAALEEKHGDGDGGYGLGGRGEIREGFATNLGRGGIVGEASEGVPGEEPAAVGDGQDGTGEDAVGDGLPDEFKGVGEAALLTAGFVGQDGFGARGGWTRWVWVHLRLLHLMNASISLNWAVPLRRSSSYIIISVEERTQPAASIRSSPRRQFNSVREPTASDATWTMYPFCRAPRAVWVTQMWLSMPQSRRVVRWPGSWRRAVRKSSLPKHPKEVFSMAGTPGSSSAISGTVSPSPRTYWAESSTGMPTTPARRMSTWELRTSSSRLRMAGRSFAWISVASRTACAGTRLGRAAGSEASVASSGRKDGFMGGS